MGDCRHFLTVIPRSTTSRNDYNLLAHRRCTVQSNPNTVIIMHVPSVTLCPLVVVGRQLFAQREREGEERDGERSPKGQSHSSGGRKRNFTRECNCIFARETRQIDLSNESRRNLSRFPARIAIFERNGHEFATGASSATRRLAFDPFCSTRRKLWLGRSDRILRRLLNNFYTSRSSFTSEHFSSFFKECFVTIFYLYLIDRIFLNNVLFD